MPLYAIQIILVVVALLTGPWPASAQDFPTKPIELVGPHFMEDVVTDIRSTYKGPLRIAHDLMRIDL